MNPHRRSQIRPRQDFKPADHRARTTSAHELGKLQRLGKFDGARGATARKFLEFGTLPQTPRDLNRLARFCLDNDLPAHLASLSAQEQPLSLTVNSASEGCLVSALGMGARIERLVVAPRDKVQRHDWHGLASALANPLPGSIRMLTLRGLPAEEASQLLQSLCPEGGQSIEGLKVWCGKWPGLDCNVALGKFLRENQSLKSLALGRGASDRSLAILQALSENSNSALESLSISGGTVWGLELRNLLKTHPEIVRLSLPGTSMYQREKFLDYLGSGDCRLSHLDMDCANTGGGEPRLADLMKLIGNFTRKSPSIVSLRMRHPEIDDAQSNRIHNWLLPNKMRVATCRPEVAMQHILDKAVPSLVAGQLTLPPDVVGIITRMAVTRPDGSGDARTMNALLRTVNPPRMQEDDESSDVLVASSEDSA
jgi:hypothetical protein